MKLKFQSKFLRFSTSFATSKLSGEVKNGPNLSGKVFWDAPDTPLSSALWIMIVGYVENVLGVIECEILWKKKDRMWKFMKMSDLSHFDLKTFFSKSSKKFSKPPMNMIFSSEHPFRLVLEPCKKLLLYDTSIKIYLRKRVGGEKIMPFFPPHVQISRWSARLD